MLPVQKHVNILKLNLGNGNEYGRRIDVEKLTEKIGVLETLGTNQEDFKGSLRHLVR